MKQLLFLLVLLVPRALSASHVAKVQEEYKEQVELTLEEQAAAKEMFELMPNFMTKITAAQFNKLQKLLQKYPRIVDEKNEDSWTALIIAAYRGNVELVKELIAAGAKLEEKNNYGWTAFMLAAQAGRAEVVTLLIAAGTKFDKKEKDGRTALMAAAYKGHVEVVKLLIAAGAKLEEKDKYGWTPLIAAAYKGRAEIIKLLVAAGANVDEKNKDGRKARDIAISENHGEIYDKAVEAGLAEKVRYEQARQTAKKEIEKQMISDLADIAAAYYQPRVPEDVPTLEEEKKEMALQEKKSMPLAQMCVVQ